MKMCQALGGFFSITFDFVTFSLHFDDALKKYLPFCYEWRFLNMTSNCHNWWIE
jgi:hypothetical protein